MKDSGVEWLGEIPAHWDVKRVRDIAHSLQTGPFGSQLHADQYVFGGHPLINPVNLRGGDLVADEESTVDDATAVRLGLHRVLEGDILFALFVVVSWAAVVLLGNPRRYGCVVPAACASVSIVRLFVQYS